MKDLVIALICIIGTLSCFAQKVITVPMTVENWNLKKDAATFENKDGKLALKILNGEDKIEAKDISFSSGIIEFDTWVDTTKFLVGISFHRQKERAEEFFYLRNYAGGHPGYWDAIQYAPFVNEILLWDMYPQFQSNANIKPMSWNRIRLVIRGSQLTVYVNNDSETPDLIVPALQGNYKKGKIALTGEGYFANLQITHFEDANQFNTNITDLTINDNFYIRDWMVSSPLPFPKNLDVTVQNLPEEDATWEPIEVEWEGLVNLTRKFPPLEDRKRQLVWLKTTIDADEEKIKKLSLGFSDEVWVYLNGQLLYLDKNYYRQPIMKFPNGRCSLENATIEVPLKKGKNELLFGVGNFFFGWGIKAKWLSVK